MYESDQIFFPRFQIEEKICSKIWDKINIPETPSVFTLELTAACNHHCVGCGNVFDHTEPSLAYLEWKEIIDRINNYAFSFRITGGECTLHPDFDLIINEIEKLNVPYVIFTNGDWANTDRIINILKKCQNCDGLLVSLQGYDANSYQAYVGIDAFERVISNIKKSIEAGLRIATNTVLTKYIHEKIEAIVSLTKKMGVFSVAFSRFCGCNLAGIELSENEFQAAFDLICQLNEKDNTIVLNNCVPACFSDNQIPVKGCTSGITHCTIGPDGYARPCTHSPIRLGNIRQNSIEQLWNSDKLKYWHSLIPEACLDCGSFSQCRGGCRALAYHKKLKHDPFIKFSNLHKNFNAKPVALEVNRDARLIVNYRVKPQEFGFYLINRSRHVAVKKEAAPILSFLNQTPQLKDIEQQLGKQALDFVGSLIVAGLVLAE